MKKLSYFTDGKRSGLGLGVVCLAFGGFSLSSAAQQPNLASPTSQPTTAAVASPTILLAKNVGTERGTVSASEPSGVFSSSTPSAGTAVTPLPEAPEPQLHKLNTPPGTPEQHIAPLYTAVIPAGYRAQPLTAHNKIVLGARDLYSLETIAAIVLSAGYAHVTDGQPNYGVNSKAFAQRLGASAARETSQAVFTEIVLAPLLHEDPRYYVIGPSNNLVKRTLYAITRPLVTKTDDGDRTVNGALLIGYAGAAALTSTYYPQSNRNFHDVASTFGASIAGAALGDFVSEFTDDVLTTLHMKRLP